MHSRLADLNIDVEVVKIWSDLPLIEETPRRQSGPSSKMKQGSINASRTKTAAMRTVASPSRRKIVQPTVNRTEWILRRDAVIDSLRYLLDTMKMFDEKLQVETDYEEFDSIPKHTRR